MEETSSKPYEVSLPYRSRMLNLKQALIGVYRDLLNFFREARLVFVKADGTEKSKQMLMTIEDRADTCARTWPF